MLGWLQRLGNFRDGFLVLAGSSYVLGYLVWSVNAWENNLGMLPALDAQYFLAGIVPLLMLALVVLGFRGERRFRRWYSVWLGTEEVAKRKWKFRLVQAINLSFVIVLVVAVMSLLLGVWYPMLLELILPILALSVMVIFFFLPNFSTMLNTFGLRLFRVLKLQPEPFIERLFRVYQLIIVYVAILFFAAIGIILYLFVAYPNIPQEFGGLRPRSAYLDISQTQVARETLEQILPADALNSDWQIVRSNKLDVYFSGHDFVLVKIHGEEVTQSTFEIKQSAILVVTWCD